MSFPKDFVWGAASSSYQIEGAWDEDGKGRSTWDDFCRVEEAVRNGDTGDVACDSYHRYPEDVALLKALGANAYRFSVSWSRIFPEGAGTVNEKGLKYYDDLVDMLLDNGIEPYMTLYHWDLPSTLEKQGGWRSRGTAEAFENYASLMAKHFDGRVKNYITINEPQCFISQGYECGRFAPGLSLPIGEVDKCMHNVLLAHGLAVRALRDGSSVPVSISVVSTGRFCYPLEHTDSAENAAKQTMFSFPGGNYSWMYTHHWLFDATVFGHYPENSPEHLLKYAESMSQSDWDIIAQPTDYLGVNIYHGNPTDLSGNVVPFYPGFPRTATKWAVTPEAMYYGPKFLYERYKMPMLIAENGLSCNDRVYLDGKVHDFERVDFLKRYLGQLKRACEEGLPVTGYLEWSLLDNFEWASGYDERFGIVYVDFLNGKRIPKDSFLWYAGIIRDNGENI